MSQPATDPDARLAGCIPILCTPFTEDGSVDHDSLRREIEWVIGEGAVGVAGLALASEGYKLTERERDEIAATIVECVAGRVAVVLSADGTGNAIAVDRARRVAAAGADYVMVLPPSFVKPTAAGLERYYRDVAEAAAPARIIIQDAPHLTGVTMSPALWAKLAESLPNLAAVKIEGTPQGETISAAIHLTEGRLAILSGWGGIGIMDALERGSRGSMPAPNFTRHFANVQRLYDAGDDASAARLHAEQLPFIVWAMQSLDHSVQSAKRELFRHGVFATELVRQPATLLDEIARRQLDRFIDARLPVTR